MALEKSDIIFVAGALAAGGVAGGLAVDVKAQGERIPFDEPPTTAVPVAPLPLPTVASERALTPASCDDSVGSVDDCPATVAADENVCTDFVARRCSEFKSAFKAKVAQAAVECLRNLAGDAACDPARVNLCGHRALMAACPEPIPDPTTSGATTSGATAILGVSVASACERIIRGCAGQPRPPTLADCRRTLAGMSDFGRARIVECMAEHCVDEGLLGCEASQAH